MQEKETSDSVKAIRKILNNPVVCSALLYYRIAPLRRKGNFKCSKERSGKKHQHQEEQDIKYRTRRQVIQGTGTENQCNGQPQSNINHYNRSTIRPGIPNTFPLSLVRFRKKLTVIGIIGHTQGVNKASSPPTNPAKKI